VVGSQAWRRGAFLHAKLEECRATCVATDEVLTVVHGGGQAGTDMYTNAWTRWHHDKSSHVARPEVHPARWEAPCRPECPPRHRRPPSPETVASRTDLKPGWDVCPRAGIYRNELMVAKGADLCLAFLVEGEPERRGAADCAWLAESAGIRTITYWSATSETSVNA
jgi:hypothetical protein